MTSAVNSIYMYDSDYAVAKRCQDREDFLLEQEYKEKRMAEMSIALAEQKAEIAEQKAEIAEQKAEIAELKRQLSVKEN